VGINNLVLSILLAEGSFIGVEEAVLNVIVITESALAAFAIVAISGVLLPKIAVSLSRVLVTLDLPLFLANAVLSLSTLWFAFVSPAVIESQDLMARYSLFAFVFSVALYLRSKGSSLFRGSAPATLAEIAPTGRVVRPMDKFKASTDASQGVLFPPEEAVVVSASSLRPGDMIKILPSEYAPCDGVVAEGSAIVEERKYVGNTALRAKERGSEIFAGSRVVTGPIDVKVGLTQADSVGAAFDGALSQVSPIRVATKESEYYLTIANLLLIFGAVLGGVISAYETSDVSDVATVVVSILSVALLVVPLDLLSGLKEAILSRAFVQGLLIKGTTVLDKLSLVRAPVFVADPIALFREPRSVNFDIMDSRVDRKSLGGVVLALALRAEHQTFREVVRLLVQKEKMEPGGIKVDDFREYDSRGVIGNVLGSEITIGHEDFLLDRGVHFQSSDLASNGGSQALFVALGEDIVARIIFESASTEFKNRGLDPLKNRGVRAVLMGATPQNMLDVHGQKLGFELSSIFGSLDEKSRGEKLGSLGDILLFDESKNILVNGDGGLPRAVSVSVFDERGATGADGEVVVFNRGPEVLSCLNSLGEKLRWAKAEGKVAAILCGIFLVVPTIAGTFSPLIPACLAVIMVGYAFLWPFRINNILGPS
jgi:cation transport ATPase